MPDAPQFKSIAIIGLGLIGGSIAKDIRQLYGKTIQIVGMDEDGDAEYALQKSIIDSTLSYEELPGRVDLIVIATPLDVISYATKKIIATYEAVHDKERYKVTVIDVASVKSAITSMFEVATNSTVEFVSTHPMAGTEFSGIHHAKLHLFEKKPWIICKHSNNRPETIERIVMFAHTLGGVVRYIDPLTHDQYAGAVSHMTILLSNYIFDFLATRAPESLNLAGDGFISTTRLASGNPDLHHEIITRNGSVVNELLAEFKSYLNKKDTTRNLDPDFFQQNKLRRDKWLENRTRDYKSLGLNAKLNKDFFSNPNL